MESAGLVQINQLVQHPLKGITRHGCVTILFAFSYNHKLYIPESKQIFQMRVTSIYNDT